MVTPEEDKRAIDDALCTLVGRARRKAREEVDDEALQYAFFYSYIHDIQKNLLDLVDFEIQENWGDEDDKTG